MRTSPKAAGGWGSGWGHFRKGGLVDDLNIKPGDDLLCIACGYDLRELPREGVCPECGLAISRSENSDQLARADPKWLAVVARGLGFYIAGQLGMVIAFICFIVIFIFAFAFPSAIPATGPRGRMGVLATGLIAAAVIGVLLMGVGAFLLTTPDPGRKEERKERMIRLLARFAIPVLILFAAIMSLLDYVPPTAIRSTVMNFSIKLLYVWGAFSIVLVMLYVARLMGQIPQVSLQKYLSKEVRFLIWAVPVYGVALWIQTVWIPAAAGGPLVLSLLFGGFGCGTSILGIFLLGTFIQQGITMIQCRRAICSCRDIAMRLNDTLKTDEQ